MPPDVTQFTGIAELAGVFVGFGALISVLGSDEAPPQVGPIRVLVTLGLTIIGAALLPLLLTSYGLDGRALWASSSLVFLLLMSVVIGLALTSPDYRRTLVGQARRSRGRAIAFWVLRVVAWVAILLPLGLAVVGANPELDLAFYLTALTFNLFEAAFILAQIVYAQVADTVD